MDKVLKIVEDNINGPYAIPLAYASISAIVLTGLLPSPAPAISYYVESYSKKQFNEKKITAAQYYKRSAGASCYAQPLWWSAILVAMVATKGNAVEKIKMGAIMAGAGALAGIVYKGIAKSKEQIEQEAF